MERVVASSPTRKGGGLKMPESCVSFRGAFRLVDRSVSDCVFFLAATVKKRRSDRALFQTSSLVCVSRRGMSGALPHSREHAYEERDSSRIAAAFVCLSITSSRSLLRMGLEM
jgi:hypothetical protein